MAIPHAMTPQRTQADFASAAMIRVVAQGMRERGLDPGTMVPAHGGARVDLRRKAPVEHTPDLT